MELKKSRDRPADQSARLGHRRVVVDLDVVEHAIRMRFQGEREPLEADDLARRCADDPAASRAVRIGFRMARRRQDALSGREDSAASDIDGRVVGQEAHVVDGRIRHELEPQVVVRAHDGRRNLIGRAAVTANQRRVGVVTVTDLENFN